MNGRHPDPEVPEKPKRRKFSAEYELRILAEADAAGEGDVGALLRREGLHWSHLIDWRNQRAKGTLGTAKPGRPAKDPRDVELEVLRAENERLRRRVEHAEAVIDVQKNSQGCLGSSRRQPSEAAGHDRRGRGARPQGGDHDGL